MKDPLPPTARRLAAGPCRGPRLVTLDLFSALIDSRTGEACPRCGDTVREVSFADKSLQYCATCQTGGKPLADRRTSKFLK